MSPRIHVGAKRQVEWKAWKAGTRMAMNAWCSRRTAVARQIALLLFFAAWTCPIANALPPGRSWMPVDTLRVPGHTWIAPDRLDTDGSGNPILFASIRGGTGRDTYGMRWADTDWITSWRLGYGVNFVRRVAAPPGRFPLIWEGILEPGDARGPV